MHILWLWKIQRWPGRKPLALQARLHSIAQKCSTSKCWKPTAAGSYLCVEYVNIFLEELFRKSSECSSSQLCQARSTNKWSFFCFLCFSQPVLDFQESGFPPRYFTAHLWNTYTFLPPCGLGNYYRVQHGQNFAWSFTNKKGVTVLKDTCLLAVQKKQKIHSIVHR